MRRRITFAAVLVALVAAGLATYSWAAASDGQTINACVAGDGKLSVANGDCKKGETPLSWNTVGPQDPPERKGLEARRDRRGRPPATRTLSPRRSR